MSDAFDLLGPPPADAPRYHGVVVALVHDNRDPERLGRVQLKYPWLGDAISDWARVAVVGGGHERGLAAVPAVDDEVLVAFEHGRIEAPYVLGGLWNGVDRPPQGPDDPAKVRSLTSVEGHVVRLDDEERRIEILTGDGKGRIVLDRDGISVVTDGDLRIESRGGKVVLRGVEVQIESRQRTQVRAGTTLGLEAQSTLEQSAPNTSVTGRARLALSGGTVDIN